MIFVTLGTHHQPFERAIDLLGTLPRREEVLVQHGPTPPRRGLDGVRWIEYLEWEALCDVMRQADVVVSHAGVGSTVTAIRARKRPVLVPRLGSLGEHVDDHQLQLATRFAERELAFVCRPGEELGPRVEDARRWITADIGRAGSGLAAAVAEAALDGERVAPTQNLC